MHDVNRVAAVVAVQLGANGKSRVGSNDVADWYTLFVRRSLTYDLPHEFFRASE